MMLTIWEMYPEKVLKTYHCLIAMVREEDGTFSALVLNLPGTGSCGSTEVEALKNVREAILGTIESHVEAGEKIPWIDPLPNAVPTGASLKWILVNT